MVGKVKWFNDEKGYGFIESPDHEGDIFVHYSNIVGNGKEHRSLEEGQEVNFVIMKSPAGYAALNVTKLN